MGKYKIVTFNLRYDNPEDKGQGFPFRKSIILEKIKQESPDIIGFQEALPHMLEWLRENLEEYTIVGVGREADYQGEHNPVAFRKERFNLFGLNVFWLSPTPYIPGSRFQQQSICPRICTVVTLKANDMNQPIRIYNVHLDHESSIARQIGMGAVLERIKKDEKEYKLPYLLMGDFNAEPHTKEIMQIEKACLRDCTANTGYTYHEFGNEAVSSKIDYIFSSQEVEHEEAVVWNEKKNGLYLSDHYPVEVTVII